MEINHRQINDSDIEQNSRGVMESNDGLELSSRVRPGRYYKQLTLEDSKNVNV